MTIGLAASGLLVLLAWFLRPGSDSGSPAAPGLARETAKSSRDDAGDGSVRFATGRSDPRTHRESPEPTLTEAEIDLLVGELRDGDEDARRRALEKLIGGLTTDNARVIQKHIAQLPSRSPESLAFYEAWGRIEGGKSVMAIAAWDSKHSAQAALAGWAGADPSAARKYFDGLQQNSHNGDGSTNHLSKEYLRIGFVRGLAEADPNLAAEFVQQQFEAREIGDKAAGDMIRAVAGSIVRQAGLEEGASWAAGMAHDFRPEALAGVAREFAAADVEATLHWLETLGEEHHQGAAYFHTFTTWMKADPAAASEYLAQMPDSYQRNEAVIAVALQTVGDDSGLALRWVESITDPASRQRGFADTFNVLGRQDPSLAIQSLETMPESPERDHAIHGFSGSVVVNHPDIAITWADQIGDLQLRETSLVTVGRSFLENDPSGAQAWFPESGLPPETVDRILAPTPEDLHLVNFLTKQ